MLTREEIFAFADSLTGATHDCPFEDDFDSTVLRHSSTGKWFGLVFRIPLRAIGREGEGTVDGINLKGTPEDNFIVREIFPDIQMAYHMNHYHWITIPLDANVPKEVVFSLIEKSYRLTEKKPKKAKTK